MLDRRTFVSTLAGAALASLAPRGAQALAKTKLVIYKSPTCGCCGNWVTHVKEFGFDTEIHDVDDVSPIKVKHKVPARLASCHTALAENYVFEGHVPADLIARVLKEKPKIAGIAVGGMPIGSPGMEMGSRKDPYDVMAFDAAGKLSVYAKR